MLNITFGCIYFSGQRWKQSCQNKEIKTQIYNSGNSNITIHNINEIEMPLRNHCGLILPYANWWNDALWQHKSHESNAIGLIFQTCKNWKVVYRINIFFISDVYCINNSNNSSNMGVCKMILPYISVLFYVSIFFCIMQKTFVLNTTVFNQHS